MPEDRLFEDGFPMIIDETHAADAKSWVSSANGHPDFPIQNLPLGIFRRGGEGGARAGIAIGDEILDLNALAGSDLLAGEAATAAFLATEGTLNPLLAAGGRVRRALRRAIFELLSAGNAAQESIRPMLSRAVDCELDLPARIGDYTDFYVGINHAENVGRQFRPDNPLLPNYKYVPIGYHGRASSVRASGAPVTRPNGQRKSPSEEVPSFGPSLRLDFELELGVWIGQGNSLGCPIPIAQAAEHVAGFCLLNDWSARDLQAWEYQPLGPFLSKNFLTTISPWIVTAEAMAPFRVAQPPRPATDPKPLDYLWDDADQGSGALAVEMQVSIESASMRSTGLAPYELSRSHATNMYWTVAQMVAHHSSNGCGLNPGDLLGTGTLSGESSAELGSLLEISRGGSEPVTLPSGERRSFLEDGDRISFAARAHRACYVSIGFGPCMGIVQSSPD